MAILRDASGLPAHPPADTDDPVSLIPHIAVRLKAAQLRVEGLTRELTFAPAGRAEAVRAALERATDTVVRLRAQLDEAQRARRTRGEVL